MIKIKMYPACQGDAFLISFDNESTNVIVDMGLQKTYTNHIRSDLIDLKGRGRSIDLLIVTHIDNDHIEGVVTFINENGGNSAVIEVKEVWHNSFRHLQFSKETRALEPDELSTLKQICYQNIKPNQLSGLQDIGFTEGITLAGLLYGHSYTWNEKLGGKAVLKQNEVIEISEGVLIRLISPNAKKLDALARVWKSKLESEKYGFTLNDDQLFDDAFEQYMKMPEFFSETRDISERVQQYNFEDLVSLAGVDRSVTNGSSIAFIIEHKNYKLLFLGDAHEGNVYDELFALKTAGYKLEFDVVKVSHHGSDNNISKRLLELISSKRFLISTNGRHSHPDLGAIAKIIDAGQDVEIITNYSHDKMDFFNTIAETRQHQVKFITASEFIVE